MSTFELYLMRVKDLVPHHGFAFAFIGSWNLCTRDENTKISFDLQTGYLILLKINI